MQFSDTTTKLGLIQDCETKLFGDNGYAQISGNTNRLYNFTARINRRQDRFIALVLQADGRWQEDDTNNTTFNVYTADIVSGQRDYTFSTAMLEIGDVAIYQTSTATEYKTITATDISDNAAIFLNNPTNTGVPTSYDKVGNSLLFDKTPNYSATAGLKVGFKRGAYYFVYTDTTREPGFPSPFHEYLSLGASLDYAMDNNMPAKVQTLFPRVTAMEQAITKHFSLRNIDEVRKMTASSTNGK